MCEAKWNKWLKEQRELGRRHREAADRIVEMAKELRISPQEMELVFVYVKARTWLTWKD